MDTTSLPAARRDVELAAFLDAFPGYRATARVDDLRDAEFARLDAHGDVYLDYTGGGLYAASQVRAHAEQLLAQVYGNPHSSNPTSVRAGELVERCRAHVLQYFNASPKEYAVVFVANASQALKLVGESFPFEPGSTFLLTFDNHNSVNGIREYVRARGARTSYVPVLFPDMQADPAVVDQRLETHASRAPNLFAFPAQSNFSGVQHPLEWVTQAQERGWTVLLDAAAFVPTNRLDLGVVHPDFVALSFYKMFGYPTGVGALIARHRALAMLRRPWFAGGTITVASVQADRHYLAPGAAAFEEGSPSYLAIPAVDLGLSLLESIGIETIHTRVACLTGWLIDALGSLRHDNGEPLVRLYGPASTTGRGATLALNFYDRVGRHLDHRLIERQANRERISLRTGCFCNPGAGETALGLSKRELDSCFLRSNRRMTFDDFRRCIDGKGSGAVRVSLGLASNFADVQAMRHFAAQFLEWSDGAED
ncbi:MAG TPA: aminotransferase class V-fold PLP-dependent enzyme [Vicinamibacterales bacterium]|nr:aminotransferase class V-fold PLP-dependent enzyme [Vicinamibacterales bacterium]